MTEPRHDTANSETPSPGPFTVWSTAANPVILYGGPDFDCALAAHEDAMGNAIILDANGRMACMRWVDLACECEVCCVTPSQVTM